MAKLSYKGAEEYAKALSQLEFTAQGGKLFEDAVRAGAAPVADEIRKRLRNLPEDVHRRGRMPSGEIYHGIPSGEKQDLLDSLGITPVGRDKKGFVNVKIGFDGYGSYKSEAYPNGLPNQMVARAVESGSSVREKTPFVRPSVTATRKKAIEEMDKTIADGLKTIFE